jgi:acyl-CoA synthetase (AMP-forming)/AMP-acid ligase II
VVDWNASSDQPPLNPMPSGAAIWQYTSGTTGMPKIAQISGANLIHNIDAIGRRIQVSDKDVNTIWLPLFHDMGLIGSLLFGVYWRISGVLMSPRMFAARPESWLWAIARFNVTCSAAPNTAYELCASGLDERKLAGLDLSSWRVAFNGAERVHRGTIERFCARYAEYGFRKQAVYPVYGLAEHTLAAAMPVQLTGAEYDWIDGQTLDAQGRAVKVAADYPGAQAMTSLGRALPGHELRIVSSETSEIARERTIGEVQLRGPSCMLGYRGEHNQRKDDDWLATGDLGYMADGQLYVVGRSKHVIKRGGKSISAELIEGSVRSVSGVRGVVAVFGAADEMHGTERIVVLAESVQTEEEEQRRIRGEILRVVHGHASCVPDVVQLVKIGSIPRTTSGKVRHTAARQAYLEGRYDA